MRELDPEFFSAHANRTEIRKRRGRLKIFFGAVAGVGKTFTMLEVARAHQAEGCEVVAGLVETRGRADTAAQLQGLELLPPQIRYHQGTRRAEFDLDAALARHPDLILVDDLAHTNLPGSRHPKRWQDIRELLDGGIDVYTTLNVQHLESLHEDVGRFAGIRVWETVPDTVFEEADEVELVDLPPDDILARLHEGKIYPPEKAERALLNLFRKGNLIALRELALRRTAEWVSTQLREYRQAYAIREVWNVDERILVCVAPDARAKRLVRAAKRLAASLHADWLALYVETPALQRLSARRRDGVLKALRLAERLGAETVTLSAPDMAEAILTFAHEHNVNKLVLGKPGRKGWRRWFLGSVVDSLISQAHDLNFYLLGDEETPRLQSSAPSPSKSFDRQLVEHKYGHWLWSLAIPLLLTAIEWPFRDLLTPANILMFYLLGVFFVAIRFGFWPSILASLANAAAFAYFFAPPIFSFAIAEPENLAGLAVTLVIGAVTGNLAENVRHQARVAESRERRASALHRLSKGLAEARSEREITEIGVYHIHAQFGGRNTFLFPDRNGRLHYPNEPPLAISLRGADLDVARWVFEHGQLAGRGTDTLPDAPAVYLPLNGSTGTIGVLALEPVELRRIFLPEPYQLLNTFVNQIVHTLERANMAEHAKEATLKMQAEALRNSLLSSISHDLRTPLATIVGAASTLETDAARLEESSKRKLVSAISEEARRMSDLTSKILEMARLEAGEVRLNRQWYAPEEIVGSALRRLDKKLKARRINVRMADGPALIHVDAVLLQQVLVNLLDNADKYSPPELPIDITIESAPSGVSIAVADRGPGIPEGLEQKIFDKFFRVHAESAQSGVGLGLSICRAVVEAHGGTIRASQRSGGGTVVQLHLPMLERPPTIDLEEKTL
ncbi:MULTISPECIES: sensor histidine kinase [Methylomicrobium]|uniref:histidine kinase n=1 Tax=Methylomicrobium album BG8 TaxID=686340 RepID=H8GH08_METAL|nr:MULTISPECIES: sensor histidine kinase KdpD [Methylomicrobium]EIC31283.1 osmosensitive K+ channel histidine kinase [Methylomicrobium album BG8]